MTPTLAAKPFPWKCGYCRQRTVQPATIPYSVLVEYDGCAQTVTLPALEVARCANCGEMVLDSRANRQISDALRRQLGLLLPEQVRSNRETLGLTRQQLADRLGVTEGTVTHWESGVQIQPMAADRLLRSLLGVLDGAGQVA